MRSAFLSGFQANVSGYGVVGILRLRRACADEQQRASALDPLSKGFVLRLSRISGQGFKYDEYRRLCVKLVPGSGQSFNRISHRLQQGVECAGARLRIGKSAGLISSVGLLFNRFTSVYSDHK